MMKLIKLVLYFVTWLPVTIIYAILSVFCDYPRKGYWWMNHATFIVLFFLSVSFMSYQENPNVNITLPPTMGKGLIFLFLWGIVGHYVLRLFFKTPPYNNLKNYYSKLFPKQPDINKVTIASKTNGSESLESITSRLAPHLQELIAKK